MIIKVLIILLILIVIGGIVLSALYLRLRPYIQAVKNFLRAFREAGSLNSFEENNSIKTNRKSNEKLVRCSSCGLWTPESKAVKLKSNIFYCSHDCLENIVEPLKQKRRSGF